MRCTEAISLIWHTGHSDETHSPDECARMVVRRRRPASLSISVDWMVAISCRPRLLRTRCNRRERGIGQPRPRGLARAGFKPKLGRDPQHLRDPNRRAAEAVADLLGVSADAEK